MEMNDYQDAAIKTAVYPDHAKVIYPMLAICEEAGEILEKCVRECNFDNNVGFGETFRAFIEAAKICGGLAKRIRKNNNEHVAELTKKLDKEMNIYSLTSDKLPDISKECGDLLWELSALVTGLDLKLNDVAKENLDKTKGRHERGTLEGSGDNR
jgi:NTP pyrophosphatase (non-canonical NTP hydrolase)